MGGGSSPRPPAVTAAVPSAADEEAASERARLYSLLRGRRGSRGLAYGPPKRMSLLAAPTVATLAPLAQVATIPALFDIGGGSGGTDSGMGDGRGETGGQGESGNAGMW